MTVKGDHFSGVVIASETKQSSLKQGQKRIGNLLTKLRLLRRT